MTALIVIEGLVILLLAVLVAGLLRSHAEILRRLHSLGAGLDDQLPAPVARIRSHLPVPAASVVGLTPDGTTLSVALAGSRGATLLAFLSSGCNTCSRFWATFRGEFQAPDIRVVVVTKSAADESLAEVRKLAPIALAPSGVITVMSTDAWEAFRVPFTPYFALIDGSTGVILGDGAAPDWEGVLGLIRRAQGDRSPQQHGTRERLVDSDAELRRAGIRPGDPILYHRPSNHDHRD